MAALLLPLLAGCSAGAGETPGRAAVHQLNDSKALTLPLDEYLLTTTDLDVLSQGRDSLMQRCLARLGAPYTPKTRESIKIETNERRYGLADPELAKEHGYHMPGGEKPAEEYPPSLIPLIRGETATHNGTPVPEGGCAGEAQRELHEAELQKGLSTPQKINMESYVKSQKDPAVTKASEEWSHCMSESGHKYPDPLSAINDQEFRGATPSPHEKEVALADVLCKRRVNLIGVWADTESTYQQAMIKANASILAEHLLAKQKTMSLARTAIGQ